MSSSAGTKRSTSPRFAIVTRWLRHISATAWWRSRFCEAAASSMSGQVPVFQACHSQLSSRSANYAPGYRFDTVIARALAALPKLVEIAGHHVGEDGVFVALKGRYPEEELKQLPNTWRSNVVELKVPGLEAGSRHAVLLTRL